MKLGGDVRTNRDLAPNIKGLTRVENSFHSATQTPLRSFLSRRKNPKGGYPVFPAEVFSIRGRGARTHPAPKVDPHSLQSLGWFRAPSPGGCLRATSRGRVFARRAGKGGVKRRREVASLATSIVRHWCMATRVCKKRVDGGIASRFSTSKWLARDHFFPSFFFNPCRVDKKLRSNYSGSLDESRKRGKSLAVDPSFPLSKSFCRWLD